MRPQLLAAAVLLALPGVAISQTPRQRNMDIRFQAMDRNGDRVVTRDEWRGSNRSFQVHDWNGDGILSGDEVRPGAFAREREESPLGRQILDRKAELKEDGVPADAEHAMVSKAGGRADTPAAAARTRKPARSIRTRSAH